MRNETRHDDIAWGIQRQIDGLYFDGDGWTESADQAYRTPDRNEAANIAAYLVRITPGWVRAVILPR